jgi:TetR/AcrR family transcriptional repressor of lmrAB and yxaGH operons
MARSNSRAEFLQTTARLLRERGYSATGIADIVSESGSPKGSLYFHFPGGKEELTSLALIGAGQETCEAIRSALFNSKTIHGGIARVFLMVTSELEKSSFRAGCPIGTVAAEAPQAPRVLGAVAKSFDDWQSVIKERLIHAGLQSRRAESLAEFILALFEGSLVLAKARQSAKPLTNALDEIGRRLKQEGLK